MDLDIVPIIPDLPYKIREPYNTALTKILRNNDHKILGSSVRYHGSSIRVEIDLKSDKEIVDKLHEIKDLEIPTESLYHIDYTSANELFRRLREITERRQRTQDEETKTRDNPF
ncbi:MAG TPA: hypothetical protein VI911_09915 [Patescibacteria group bacterium]|nr:hypothetical protein [Patescibacteria group bacterium]